MIQKLKREDWAESWKRHFKPLEFGSTLLIRPGWIKRPARKGQRVVVLDPGLSFGTGQHPTTAFCLRIVAKLAPKRQRTAVKSKAAEDCRTPKPGGISRTRSLLDIGTGSGILAIAAAKLGYAPVDAFDFDPEAVGIARANARRNRVGEKLRIWRADVTAMRRKSSQRYDLICANLIAPLLLSERERILARLAGDGVLVLAGILEREFREIQRGYEGAGLGLVDSQVEGEWRSGAFVRKKLNGFFGMGSYSYSV